MSPHAENDKPSWKPIRYIMQVKKVERRKKNIQNDSLQNSKECRFRGPSEALLQLGRHVKTQSDIHMNDGRRAVLTGQSELSKKANMIDAVNVTGHKRDEITLNGTVSGKDGKQNLNCFHSPWAASDETFIEGAMCPVGTEDSAENKREPVDSTEPSGKTKLINLMAVFGSHRSFFPVNWSGPVCICVQRLIPRTANTPAAGHTPAIEANPAGVSGILKHPKDACILFSLSLPVSNHHFHRFTWLNPAAHHNHSEALVTLWNPRFCISSAWLDNILSAGCNTDYKDPEKVTMRPELGLTSVHKLINMHLNVALLSRDCTIVIGVTSQED
ncbi:hypothetical protein GALMADRAFT_217250 [Galerina marginata CBS 339.88]|uniref:Uncharacterized protein n=1 Tax=Galerina marginata (strain CBS 339.88) TaxID=685588 RepID=A0A067S5D3_GALM3|nr:hypothetical protein GALMADRAFT_217250 [Galerina marginata CBS 339.88]